MKRTITLGMFVFAVLFIGASAAESGRSSSPEGPDANSVNPSTAPVPAAFKENPGVDLSNNPDDALHGRDEDRYPRTPVLHGCEMFIGHTGNSDFCGFPEGDPC